MRRFNECPYSYYLSYIEGHKQLFPDYVQKVINVGRVAHKTIEAYYAQWPPRELIGQEMERLITFIVGINPLEGTYKQRYETAMENFASFERRRRRRDNSEPLSEVKVKCHSNDVQETGVIDFYNPSTGRVIDFKTSKYDGNDEYQRLQLNYYYYLLKTELGEQANLYNYYLLSDDVVKVDVEHNIQKNLKALKNQIMNAHSTEEFPRKTGGQCERCPLKLYCIGDE